MANDELNNLRAAVRKRRAAVTAKERRIYNNTGIDIKGTNEDPRRPPSVVNKYNRNQLNTYLADLNAFMLRSNGYVPDASGGFIRKRDWLNYKKIERQFNKIAEAHFDSVKDILDPYRGKTIRETELLYRPDSKMAQGDILHRPYSEIYRNPKNIKNAQALDKLAKQLAGKTSKDYLPKQIKSGRQQANSMLDNAGLSEFKEVIAKISDHQFNVLWNYWGFATRLGQIGSSGSHRDKATRELDGKDRLSSQDKENIRNDVDEMIQQATAIKDNANFRKNNATKIPNNGFTPAQQRQRNAIEDNAIFRARKDAKNPDVRAKAIEDNAKFRKNNTDK